MNFAALLLASCIVLLIIACLWSVISGCLKNRGENAKEKFRDAIRCIIICFPLVACLLILLWRGGVEVLRYCGCTVVIFYTCYILASMVIFLRNERIEAKRKEIEALA